ncbi:MULTISPECIES: Asp-tRNA(Asn)/Glu-tRNA(Gln) amidotransferase subunit GatC [Thiomicrorhabdus]|uniref:Aspartyl/glutamyl-tRNA(Asn/Gln) amidotransferase subunit C n=1 Tax=Thiomicrorhabdus heinhorstiae TaxID=2748010 RepID=A0ABS0BYJ6_9GAMM|nr:MULTISPECIES: Asp-tRNA(Asn)/Glu-tRNA(Gln) amidotransferase subunit GatC [Thiomicrorhabdus]MBF6057152.1 Asp-tRNA(Asn)/Glu-tRNA(Gln) amidotransferase subunit GatC [Thiomicrorhabdus heinhorstiae]
MSIGKSEVEYISRLAMIDVAENEVEQVSAKLSKVLDLFAQMEAVNTEGVEPMAHPHDVQQRLRADEITETDQHEKLQSVAPATAKDMYLVPQVIE